MDGVRILLVDDDFRNIFALSALLERGHAEVTIAESGAEALDALERMPEIDIVLMDIMMPVMDGYETIRAIRRNDRLKAIPIIAVTGKVVEGERRNCLDAGADDYVPKPVDIAELLAAIGPWLPAALAPGSPSSATTGAPGLARAPQGVDALVASLSPVERAVGLADARGVANLPKDGSIEGANILVVDDDFRNSFAMSALLERGLAVVTLADSGAEALATLERMPEIDIVLMDIMMPVMDGYETMRTIRAIDRYKSLPIIALTGKVMAGERERCIAAGATDYVPKPVDTAELLAAVRRWLPVPVGPAS